MKAASHKEEEKVMTFWIDAVDESPDFLEWVLVHTVEGDTAIGYLSDDFKWYFNGPDPKKYSFCRVTHWMPLPENPKI